MLIISRAVLRWQGSSQVIGLHCRVWMCIHSFGDGCDPAWMDAAPAQQW
jgi:hypothetical protein